MKKIIIAFMFCYSIFGGDFRYNNWGDSPGMMLKNENLSNQYLYIQAKNHKNFLKDYLKDIDLTNINHLKIEDDLFDIYAKVEPKDSTFVIDIFVKAKNYDISLYEQFSKIP